MSSDIQYVQFDEGEDMDLVVDYSSQIERVSNFYDLPDTLRRKIRKLMNDCFQKTRICMEHMTVWILYEYDLSHTHKSPIGVACLTNQYSTIYNVCIHPRYRRKGLGTLLIQTIIQYAIKHRDQHPNLYLTVVKRNKSALTLYQQLGFEIVDPSTFMIPSQLKQELNDRFEQEEEEEEEEQKYVMCLKVTSLI